MSVWRAPRLIPASLNLVTTAVHGIPLASILVKQTQSEDYSTVSGGVAAVLTPIQRMADKAVNGSVEKDPSVKSVQIGEIPDYCNSSGSSVDELVNGVCSRVSPSPPASRRRLRTMSGSKSEHHLLTTKSGRKIYTKGRPPWYDKFGNTFKQPYVIGICGGSASGKTTVAEKIIEKLEIPWVTILSMDSFYKVLTRLREGKNCEVPVYDFTTHSRDNNPKMMYGADVLIFEGILAFHRPDITEMMDMKVFVDTDGDVRLARRLNRDINERGRDTIGVLDQYFRFVKPAFEAYIAPGMKVADIIVPRGGDNDVAINLIAKQVKTQLIKRGYDQTAASQCRHDLVNMNQIPDHLPDSLTIIRETPQMGKILIQTNDKTMEPELYYLRLPKDIDKYKVMLLDATVATGAAAMMAIRILLDHDVPEENIYVLSLLMSEPGVHALAYAFPKVRLITTAVDSQLSDNFYVLPGMGNFGDRYYGTYVSDTEGEEPFEC
ncbi:putative uridine kinase [Necator americanus]|uniref:uridine/cytidine kinase n=1 Tax=Necator americanus TaxID=51031 RepID=W2SH13_NECAM|nr:putative uridine kinase [Necator americanus]ETN68818.1 putative uridine kinase [Necator americanus]